MGARAGRGLHGARPAARSAGLERGARADRGAAALAQRCGVTIAGGDVTAAPALFVSFTVVGWVEDPGDWSAATARGPETSSA